MLCVLCCSSLYAQFGGGGMGGGGMGGGGMGGGGMGGMGGGGRGGRGGGSGGSGGSGGGGAGGDDGSDDTTVPFITVNDTTLQILAPLPKHTEPQLHPEDSKWYRLLITFDVEISNQPRVTKNNNSEDQT
ncbi:MAG: hypothetical protein ABGW78_12595 [Pirellulales bacterium]